MSKVKRRGVLYGILLVAGITLGMQLSDSGNAEQTDYFQNGRYGPYDYGSTLQSGQAGMNNSYSNPGYVSAGGGGTANGYASGYGFPGVATGNGTGSATGYGTGHGTGYGAVGGIGPGTDDLAIYGGGLNESRVQTPADLLMPDPEPPAIDRFADKTAGLLQQASRKGIHWFASLFGPTNE